MRHTRYEPRALLVVRDRMSIVIEQPELAPTTHLRAALTAARNARIAAGWEAEDIGPRCAFFFASRDGECVLVGVERIPPRNPF
jgi:hypothetical protein